MKLAQIISPNFALSNTVETMKNFFLITEIFLPFYKAIFIGTCADYKPFQALSNTVKTMKKFLLVTEILTHEY